MTHDDSTRAGSPSFTQPGIGLVSTRHCMPCDRRVSTPGGKYLRYLGAPRIFHCTSCVAKRERKAVAA